jgi:hypothetical protein
MVFLFNTASGIIFAILALYFSGEFWLFLANPILAVLACAAAFRDEWLKHRGETSRRTTRMIPEIKSIWSTGGLILYLFLYTAILVYPTFLSGAVILSVFFIPETFVELGRFIAHVAMRRRKRS